MIAASPAPLDRLEEDDRHLLSVLIELNFNLLALARRAGCPALDIIRWFRAPHIAAAIAEIHAAAEEAAGLRAAQARLTAIDTLERLAATSEIPTEQRRAATTLLRSPGRSALRADTPPTADLPTTAEDITRAEATPAAHPLASPEPHERDAAPSDAHEHPARITTNPEGPGFPGAHRTNGTTSTLPPASGP